MSINSAPNIVVFGSLDATQNNTSNIRFSINNQSEAIIKCEADIFQMSDGSKICTYTNTEVSELGSMFTFPIYITSQSTNVSWQSPFTISSWVNNKEYFIKIRVLSASGWSAYSVAQPFVCVLSATALFSTIPSPISITTATPTVTVDVKQNTYSNVVDKYQFVLSDSNGEVVKSTDWIYGYGTPAGSNKYEFSTIFSDLENGETYTAYFLAELQLGSIIQCVSNEFTVNTNTTLIGGFDIENIYSKGYINIQFNGNSSNDITLVRLERREVGTNTWVKLYDSIVRDNSDISFTFKDYFARTNVEYQYRVTPIIKQGEYEMGGTSALYQNNVKSCFDKTYVVGAKNAYGFRAEVSIDAFNASHKTALFEPIGAEYPTIVRNSNAKYHTGSMSGMIMPLDFDDNKDMVKMQSRLNSIEVRDMLTEFLSDGYAKIIKDWNGNIWLVTVTDDINVSLNSYIGMGIGNISFNWCEIGDAYDSEALSKFGLTNVL